MKFIVAFTPTTGGKPVYQKVEGKDSNEVAHWFLTQDVTTFTIIPENKITDKTVYLSSPYDPKVVAISKSTNVEIAAEDYNIGGREVDGVHYFTHDEALEVQERLKDTGWRLPTRSEWVLICEEFGQKDGQLDAQTLYKNLNMGLMGFYDFEFGKLYNRTTDGHWWSATRSSAAYANALGAGTSLVYPQYINYRGNGFALRLVRDAKENN